jgi:hypothetical protein
MKDQAGKIKATYDAQGNCDDKNRFKKAQEANQAESSKAALKGLMKSSAKNCKTVGLEQPDDEVNALKDLIKNNFDIDNSGNEST